MYVCIYLCMYVCMYIDIEPQKQKRTYCNTISRQTARPIKENRQVESRVKAILAINVPLLVAAPVA
jgi:hypothetical protein